MKKVLAALLAVSLTAALAGCNKSAEEQVISDVSEETYNAAETAETTETTFGTTETITEETSEETTTGVVSDTKISAEAFSESNDIPRLAQHEDLIGSWYIEDTVIFIFEENRYIGFGGAFAEIVNDTVKNGKLEFTNDTWFEPDSAVTAEIIGEKLYIKTEIDGEVFSEELERYTQPAVSVNAFDGKWILEDNDKYWGELNLENGKGTFSTYGKDRSETDAEISLNGNKVTFYIGDYNEEYTYYTLEHPNALVKFIFLLNDKTAFYIACWD